MGQGITPGTEPSSNGQKEPEEFGEDGIGHLWALSPRCQMMMFRLAVAILTCTGLLAWPKILS